MTSQQVYNEILYRVNTSRGAPMGRSDKQGDPTGKRIYKRRVMLDAQGYDKGGAYWGIGAPLYVSYTLDKTYIKFERLHDI